VSYIYIFQLYHAVTTYEHHAYFLPYLFAAIANICSRWSSWLYHASMLYHERDGKLEVHIISQIACISMTAYYI
jgi:hypothetical protein